MELLNYAESMQRSMGGEDFRLRPGTGLQQGDWGATVGMGQTQNQLFGWADMDSQVEIRSGGYEHSNSDLVTGSSRLGRQLHNPQLLASRPLSSNSFDERPLPRLEDPEDPPLPQDESPKNQKRPFLKRGSRLLKSVIPKRGDKQSWVAEFKGKIAAVPKPMTDVQIDEEQFESADWGVLNAQKVSRSRSKVHPVSKVKKAGPVRGSKGEAVTRSAGNFLKAGSRGVRSASVQSNGPGKPPSAPPPSAAARKLAPPAKQPEAPHVDDLELAEFQALERRLRGHVLEDAEPPLEDHREMFQSDCEEIEKTRAGVEEQAFEESWEPQRELEGGEEPKEWTGEDGAYEWEEGESVRLSAEQLHGADGNPGAHDWEGGSLFRDSKQWDNMNEPANSWGPAEVQGHQVRSTTDFQRHPVGLTEPPDERTEQAEVPGRGPLSRGKAGPPMPGDAAGVSALVKTIFQKEPEKPKRAERPKSGPDLGAEMGFLKEKMSTLESEIQRFKRENERMERAKQEFEARAEVLAKERATWEKRMLEEEDAWNRKREAEAQKLKRDKRVLEQQSRALLQLPSRKARSEADELRAQIAAMEEDKRVREARWRLTVDRLKGRVDELTERCKELEGEVKGHETRWLEHEDAQRLASKPKQAVRPQSASLRANADPALQTTSRNRIGDAVPGRINGQKERRSEGAVPGLDKRGSNRKGGKETGPGTRPQTAFELGGGYVDENEIDALVRKGRELSNGAEDWTAVDHSAFRVSNECASGQISSNGMEAKTTSNGAAADVSGQRMQKRAVASRGMVESGWSESQIEAGGSLVGRTANERVGALLVEERRQDHLGTKSKIGLGEDTEKELGAGLENRLGDGLVNGLEATEDEEDELWEEIPGAAGKLERIYASGKRVVVFGNGTKKEVHPSGKVCIFFTNGDVKNTHTDGRVEYYYAEVATWHTQYADGVEVFHFPNGQVEQHDPDGSKEIFFPDGAVRKVNVDGSEEEVATFE